MFKFFQSQKFIATKTSNFVKMGKKRFFQQNAKKMLQFKVAGLQKQKYQSKIDALWKNIAALKHSLYIDVKIIKKMLFKTFFPQNY